jgi:hypothetical protein
MEVVPLLKDEVDQTPYKQALGLKEADLDSPKRHSI